MAAGVQGWGGRDEALLLVPRAALPHLFALVGDAVPLRLLDTELVLSAGDLVIDLVARTVTRGGRLVPLHPREFAVLACLARHRGAAVSRADLYAEVWGRRFDPGTNVIAVTVSRLRARLGTAAAIRTVAGGYALVSGTDAD